MSNDPQSLFPNLTWSRFNSDFRVPESEDAARVAIEVKASVHAWLQKSLEQLEKDMAVRAELAIGQLTVHLAAAQASLQKTLQGIETLRAELSALNTTDPALKSSVDRLNAQIQTTREAVAKTAEEWAAHGANTVSTIKTVIGTVAKLAA
jgi:chromosome segregation ATPase